MAEAAGLIEKFRAEGSDDPSTTAELHQQILSFKPEWDQYEATRSNAAVLKMLEADAPALKTKTILQGHMGILQGCMDGMAMQEEKPVQWILTLLYDMLREDSSCYNVFDQALNQRIGIYKPLMALMQRQKIDTYSADKAAWVLSAVVGNLPRFFDGAEVEGFLRLLLKPAEPACTELGILEAIANLLKSDVFRGQVWEHPGVADCIFRVQPRTAPAPHVYRCVFSIWMLSFDEKIALHLKSYAVVKKIKDILTHTSVEKVVRLCLTVLKNFLTSKALCEEIVEEGILEAVQQLEFEKWRDAELYDDIHDTATHISSEVQEMSNFERYERELQSGSLTWGFIHSSKFWAENVLKFEQNDFRALKMLAGMLQSSGTDTTTLAVACHDLGEFVALHPLGKKMVGRLQVKERVMQLMGSTDASHREVRREALLCCQKIMLNKWQEMDTIA